MDQNPLASLNFQAPNQASPYQDTDPVAAEDRSQPSIYRMAKEVPEGKRTSVEQEDRRTLPKLKRFQRFKRRKPEFEPDFQDLWVQGVGKSRVPRELGRLIGLSLLHNEVYFPLEEVGIHYKEAMLPGDQKIMDTQSLQRSISLVTAREGVMFSTSMKWLKIIFILTSILALLSSAIIGITWSLGHNVLEGSLLVNPVLIPIWLVVAFNLGLTNRKLGSYGWHRLRRLLWLRGSQNQSVKDWRENGHSHGDSTTGTKQH